MSAVAHQPLDFEECECEDCRFWRTMEPVLAKYRDSKERREANAIYKALMLADSLETGEALLRGESVPIERLNKEWVRRYGLR